MAFEGWVDGIPPKEWKRMLTIDVGGATPWAFEWGARDPHGYVVAYDEVSETTTDVRKLAEMAKARMKFQGVEEYEWLFKACDYENRIAMEDLRKYGIQVTNAVKHNKLASIHRLAGYLHPNPKRPFPSWHPRAGQAGSPLLFVHPRCKVLIAELPQQRWKEGQGDNLKDEADRTIRHDTVDCLLYMVRLLPAPEEVKIIYEPKQIQQIDLMSRLYHEDVKRQKERLESQMRRPYRQDHRFNRFGGILS